MSQESETVKQPLPEPWLRGPIEGVQPFVMPVFFSFAQVREDLVRHTAGLTHEQDWRIVGRNSVGFHLKHIAGSVDRLTTYLCGLQLSPSQLEYLKREHDPDAGLQELLERMEQSLAACEHALSRLDAATIFDPRAVGRRALPTTVLGLIVHLAEHTQRHLGQLITLAHIVRQPA